MSTRFYLYLSKHKAQDQRLDTLIEEIPKKQRNRVLKHILLAALSTRSKQRRSGKALPTHQQDMNSQQLPLRGTDAQENPLTSNPLATLQQALDKIPLKRQS